MFRNLCVLALLWGALGSPPTAAAAPPELVVSPQTPALQIDHGVEILIEQTGEGLTRERVMQPDMAGRWMLYPRRMVNILGERRPVWLRFRLRGTSHPQERILSIEWPVVSEVRFSQYLPDSDSWRTDYVGGLSHPNAPIVRRDPNPIFPVLLGVNERVTVLLRVQAPTSVAVPMVLWDSTAWQASRFDYLLGMGCLFGILAVMFFYNLSLYVFSRESSYGLYSVYLLTVVAYQLCVTGLGPLLIWPGHDWLTKHGYEFFASSSFLAATLFTRHFLRLRECAPWYIDWLSRGFIAFFGVVTVLLIFKMPVVVPLAMPVGGFVLGLSGIYTGCYLALRGDVLARYFVVAWSAVIAATVMLLLALGGVVETGGWMIFIQPLGFVLETVLLSIALVERIKRERLSKEAALVESQKLSRRVQLERDEKIRAQEHALAIQRQANEELEARVRDRTKELKTAMECVELANRELSKISITDALTGVHNRRYFDETIKKEFDRSTRSATPLALLMIDIDHFKRINDTVGHLGGDECLKCVATAIASVAGRSTDLVARYGGEEFAVLLFGLDRRQALVVADRLRNAVEALDVKYEGERIPVTVSVGVVARIADTAVSIPEFIAKADRALYAAKHAGRNQAKLAEEA